MRSQFFKDKRSKLRDSREGSFGDLGSEKNKLSQKEREKTDERFLATWLDRWKSPPDFGENKVKNTAKHHGCVLCSGHVQLLAFCH